VAKYPSVSPTAEAFEKRQVIFGLKACDLLGKKVLDEVFLKGEYIDSLYERCSKNTIIISGDCTEALPSCFCTMIGLQPYLEEEYDLNMSPVNGGYIFESGSKEGEQIIEDHLDLFAGAGGSSFFSVFSSITSFTGSFSVDSCLQKISTVSSFTSIMIEYMPNAVPHGMKIKHIPDIIRAKIRAQDASFNIPIPVIIRIREKTVKILPTTVPIIPIGKPPKSICNMPLIRKNITDPKNKKTTPNEMYIAPITVK